jgi:thymidylate synthase (FAD)
MKLIKPKACLIEQAPGLNGIYKQIELAGRTCYKSEDKITEDSAKGFVDRMIKSNHTAMLEHGTVYLKVPVETWREDEHEWAYMFPEELPWVSLDCDGKYQYITTNFRYILEGNVGIETMNKYLCSPTEFHEKRYTFKVTTSIGVTREFNRHRVNSIAEQSTRYCNYSKDKFGKEVTFCIPSWLDFEEDSYKWDEYFDDGRWVDDSSPIEDQFIAQCFSAENQYINLIEQGWQPQQAREVLPLCTATEAVYTAFESDWKHFFDLRLRGTTGKPHPNMQELAELMHEQLKQKGIEL